MKYQKDDLAGFPRQILYALDQYKPHGLKLEQFDNVLLCGLGGSGIAGRIIKSLYQDSFPKPVEVISEYRLPAYTGKKTLAILCSYSGNTEETTSMYAEAKKAGATLIAIATGGKLKELAEGDHNLFYPALAGLQPRMALGYSFTYLYLIFGELMGKDTGPELKAAAEAVNDSDFYIKAAEKYLDRLKDNIGSKIIVITDPFLYPVGLRFCQQIQENAKGEAFVHELPESNHNVIESYYGKLDSHFILMDGGKHPRTSLRFQFLKDVLEKNGNSILDIPSKETSLTGILQVLYTLDWLSLWIAEQKKVHSSHIPNINALKEFLSKK